MTSTFRSWDIDSDEEEEEEAYSPLFGGREAMIFLIEASNSMVENNEDDKSYYQQALKCVHSTMMNKIISSDKDFIGTVLFSTKEMKNSCDFPNIYVLQDLDQPSATAIKQVESLLDDCDFASTLHGHGNVFSLNDAFWICQKMFSNCPVKLSYMKILLLTCEDSPHKGDTKQLKQICQKARDLKDNNISLDLLPIGEHFDNKLIYQDVMSEFDNAGKLCAPSIKFEELLTHVRRKDHTKRTIGRMELELCPGASLGIALYNTVRPLGKPKKVYLDRDTNEEVLSLVKQFNGETGEILLPSDILKYQEFDGKKIKFTQEEIKAMKDFGPAKMTLIGFVPNSYLEPENFIHSASFIYPDDGIISGSTKLFRTLLDCCVSKSKMPVCWWVPRKRQGPRLVILLPQKEVLDKNDSQIEPPGFHVIFMPFADDIRTLKYVEPITVQDDEVEVAKALIKKLRFTYSPESFENPVIQKLWSSIEALALDREDNEITDYTVPDVKAMRYKAAADLDKFKSLVSSWTTVKRISTSIKDAPLSKKKKDDTIDIEADAKAGKVEKLTVNVLREFLLSVGCDVKNKKKADLVTCVYDHFSK